MAVYKRGYNRYRGSVQGRWARMMVLPRFAWRRLFQQRLVVLLLVASMIWPIICATFLYMGNNLDLLKGMQLGEGFMGFIRGNNTFFLYFMNVQAVFTVFLAALTGPGCIAPDLANNALPLYFSRPITRTEYALGRLVTLMGLLSIVTWIPGLILFGMQAAMAEASWFSENWHIGTALLCGFLLWILLVSLVAMTGSAYVKMKAVAGGLVFGFFFLLAGAAGVINLVFNDQWGNVINPTWTARRIWHALLGTDPPAGPGALLCFIILAAGIVLLSLILRHKLRPVEVIR
jgi:ABC-2 type transport system permease protein